MEFKQVFCPHCGKRFFIRVPDEPGKEGRYRLSYSCPGCGTELREESGFGGKKGEGGSPFGGSSFDKNPFEKSPFKKSPFKKSSFEKSSSKGSGSFSPFFLLCLPFEVLTVAILVLGLAGRFLDITGVFSGLDRLLDQALRGGMVLNDQNISLLSRVFVVMCCFSVHECSHALVAYLLGDDTAKAQGRISLNPSRHLEPIGALATLFLGIGYARPVPVNIYRFKNKKRDFALTSVAGPLSNLCMAILLLWMTRGIFFDFLSNGEILGYFLFQAAYINVSLAVFNLLPIPPLDGSRLAFLILPDKTYDTLMRSGNRLLAILMLGSFLLGRMGYYPFSSLMEGAFRLVYTLAMSG